MTKMRATAIGDNRIPQEKRFYVEVLYPMDSKVDPKMFYFDQTKRFGQVLDQVASAGKIRNENNVAGKPKLVLMSLKTGKSIPLNKVLGDCPELVVSGDPILLEYDDNLQ